MRGVFAVAVACAMLAGCQTTSPTVPATPSLEDKVQQTTAAVCGFVPTISTVAQILASFTSAGPAVDTAAEVARAICKAVGPVSPAMRKVSRKAVEPPKVNGVVIEGYFLR